MTPCNTSDFQLIGENGIRFNIEDVPAQRDPYLEKVVLLASVLWLFKGR